MKVVETIQLELSIAKEARAVKKVNLPAVVSHIDCAMCLELSPASHVCDRPLHSPSVLHGQQGHAQQWCMTCLTLPLQADNLQVLLAARMQCQS